MRLILHHFSGISILTIPCTEMAAPTQAAIPLLQTMQPITLGYEPMYTKAIAKCPNLSSYTVAGARNGGDLLPSDTASIWCTISVIPYVSAYEVRSMTCVVQLAPRTVLPTCMLMWVPPKTLLCALFQALQCRCLPFCH